MTTIAASLEYKTIASDSRVSGGTGGPVRCTGKLHKIPGGWAGFSGEVRTAMPLIEWLQGGCKKRPKLPDGGTAEVLILKRDRLYTLDHDFILLPLDEPFWAIGSGADAARAAMTLGADPEYAVEVACDVDRAYSSLPVHTKTLTARK